MKLPQNVKARLVKRVAEMTSPDSNCIIHFCIVRPGGVDTDPLIMLATKPELSTRDALREQYKTVPAVKSAVPAKMWMARGVIEQRDGIMSIHPAPDSKSTAPTVIKKAFTDLKDSLKSDSLNVAWISRIEQSKTRVLAPIDPRKLGNGTVDDDEGPPPTSREEQLQLPAREAPEDMGVAALSDRSNQKPDELSLFARRFEKINVVNLGRSLAKAGPNVKEESLILGRAQLARANESLLALIQDADQVRARGLSPQAGGPEQRRFAQLGQLIVQMEQTLSYGQDVLNRVDDRLDKAARGDPEDLLQLKETERQAGSDLVLPRLVEELKKLRYAAARDNYLRLHKPELDPKPKAAELARARVALVGARNSMQKVQLATEAHIQKMREETGGATRHARSIAAGEDLVQRIEAQVLEVEELVQDAPRPILGVLDLDRPFGNTAQAINEPHFAPVATRLRRVDTAIKAAQALYDKESPPKSRAELARLVSSSEKSLKSLGEARVKAMEKALEEMEKSLQPMPPETAKGDQIEAWLYTLDARAGQDPRQKAQFIQEEYTARRYNHNPLFMKETFMARQHCKKLSERLQDVVDEAESSRLFVSAARSPDKGRARAFLLQSKPEVLQALARKPGGAKLMDDLVADLGSKVSKGDMPFMKAALAARFNMNIGGADLSRKATPSMYKLFLQVPESHARDNKKVAVVNRQRKKSGGGDYLNGKINIEVQRSGYLAPTIDLKVGAGQKKSANFFNHTVLHEIGHAVDDDLSFMDSHMEDANFGAWETSSPEKIAALVFDHFKTDPALTGLDAGALKDYFKAVLEGKAEQPVKGADGRRPLHLPTLLKSHQSTRICALIAPTEGEGLWWKSESVIKSVADALGGRVPIHSYADEWHVYKYTARANIIRDYQFRAPGEWFAEIYAAYFMGLLNSKDKVWFEREIVKPGHGQST
jgi:hypothetical protein